MWWLHPSLHLTRTGVWSYCLQVRPVGWARLSLHRGQARAWVPEPTKAVPFWLCCFIRVQSWSQVVKKYVNSQRNYWDVWDRCLKACTYFSLPSQFAGTTVTIAFLLLALLLLPSAYGWGKQREIEDFKKNSKRRQHHRQTRRNLPLVFDLLWKRRMWSQCEKEAIAYQGCVLRNKWAGWYFVLCVLLFLHLARAKQEHEEENEFIT